MVAKYPTCRDSFFINILTNLHTLHILISTKEQSGATPDADNERKKLCPNFSIVVLKTLLLTTTSKVLLQLTHSFTAAFVMTPKKSGTKKQANPACSTAARLRNSQTVGLKPRTVPNSEWAQKDCLPPTPAVLLFSLKIT